MFALPLTDGGFLLGVVIERDRRSAHVGFVPDEVNSLPISTPSIVPSALGVLTWFETDDLDRGVWPLLGRIEPFEQAEWPHPPSFAGDTASTSAAVVERMDFYVQARRRLAIADATFLAEHPELADPRVGALYLRLPTETVIPFIQAKLAHWGTLPRLVLERVDLAEGVVLSTLPAEVGADVAADEPQWGGKLRGYGRRLIRGHHVYPDGRREAVYDNRLSVQTMISDWLGSGLGHACVLGLPLSSTSVLPTLAARFGPFGGQLMSLDEEHYLLLPESVRRDGGALSNALINAHSDWHAIGFLMTLERGDPAPATVSRTTIEQLGALADRVEAILIGAYDGEGYLVWTKTNGDRWVIG